MPQKSPVASCFYDSVGVSLKVAVELSGKNTWRVRLSECINPSDAHATDVLYHNKCWVKNLTNFMRKTKKYQSAKRRHNSNVGFLY